MSTRTREQKLPDMSLSIPSVFPAKFKRNCPVTQMIPPVMKAFSICRNRLWVGVIRLTYSSQSFSREICSWLLGSLIISSFLSAVSADVFISTGRIFFDRIYAARINISLWMLGKNIQKINNKNHKTGGCHILQIFVRDGKL